MVDNEMLLICRAPRRIPLLRRPEAASGAELGEYW